MTSLPAPKPDTIFCLVRKKWVKRTPEEEVRQAILHHLAAELQYPFSLMAVEYNLTINRRKRRCDIVVFDSQRHVPVLIIECKAAYVELSDKVLDQVLHYNLGLKVPHLLISNGHRHVFYSWDAAKGHVITQPRILSYAELLS